MCVGTGEHGVGVGKKEYLVNELGEGTVELMRVVKRAVDPHNLLNPGKASLQYNVSTTRITSDNLRPKLYPNKTEVTK